MPTLSELVRSHTALGDAELAWLQRLVADWQVVADLSFADLLLWLPDRDGEGFWAGAQMRPTTGPTAYVDDIVGQHLPIGRRALVDEAWRRGRIAREGDPEWRDDVPVRVEAIPVRFGERVIAVVARHTNLLGVRTPSRLELAYLQTAGELTRMIAEGTFPAPGQRSDHADSPRVGDGFVRIDAAGVVGYASPNATSLFRRLGLGGDLTGRSLAETTRALVPPRRRPDEEVLGAVLDGRWPRDTEIDTGEVAFILRALPLRPSGGHIGALILMRDVTELRRRDQELISKDATIREIHHRVKNNLQTVAALLRLQARRIDSPGARASLEEAVRRVGSIAIVHDMLSQSVTEQVAFDDVVDQLARMVTDVSTADARVTLERRGRFGALPSETATTVAMVLTELLQNSLEHGYPEAGSTSRGRVLICCERDGDRLRWAVDDDGVGLPPGLDLTASTTLGLSIVRTLVQSELHGTLAFGASSRGGTRVSGEIHLE